jgi:hypothetical protein
MKLQTGDILLVDTEGFIPSKIDKFQGNDYNHAGFIVCIYGETYVFEAIDSGMAFTPFSLYTERLGKEDMRLLVVRPKENIWNKITDKDLMRFILPLTRQKYEFSNLLFHQAIRYIAKKLNFELWIGRRKAKATEKFICGELVMHIYNNFFGWFEDVWYKGAPVDIFNNPMFDHIEYKDGN